MMDEDSAATKATAAKADWRCYAVTAGCRLQSNMVHVKEGEGVRAQETP